MSGITFDRGTGPVEFLIQGGEWWVRFPERLMEDAMSDADKLLAEYNGKPPPTGPIMVQINGSQLFNMLSPEELRLVMGHCSHITEQAFAEAAEMVGHMNAALAARSFTALGDHAGEIMEYVRNANLAQMTSLDIYNMQEAT
jgi:hypothetical protein